MCTETIQKNPSKSFRQVRKATGWRVNIIKSPVFLSTGNKYLENKIFLNAAYNINKRQNWMKYVQYLSKNLQMIAERN